MTSFFSLASADSVRDGLRRAGYLADDHIASVTWLASKLGKPVLVEGPAGTGKTELAKSVAQLAGAQLFRLQCYEGLDEARALYEWNYRKQLLRVQAGREPGGGGADWAGLEADLFSEEFLLARPLLQAIRAGGPAVLLVDEVDRVDIETEALLLELLAEYQVTVPELGTIRAAAIPLVFLTSNGTRQLSEALKRRCLYLHLGYPSPEREQEIITTRLPGISERLARQVAGVVAHLRTLDLRKHPSISETLDWATTLMLLGVSEISAQAATDTLHVLLKHQADIEQAAADLAAAAP